MKRLNIEKPDIIARATEHIEDMLKYVQELLKMDMLMKQVKEFILIYQS